MNLKKKIPLIYIIAYVSLLVIAVTILPLITANVNASTILSSQVGIPQLANQFGFTCLTSVTNNNNINNNNVTTCQVDSSYILSLAIPCPAGQLPCPTFQSGVAPSPGACPSTGTVIITNQPAIYFCAQTVPGLPSLNWIKVVAENTW